MRKHSILLHVLSSWSVLLTTACSHPLPKLAYPDGSNRIPINVGAHKAPGAPMPKASSPTTDGAPTP